MEVFGSCVEILSQNGAFLFSTSCPAACRDDSFFASGLRGGVPSTSQNNRARIRVCAWRFRLREQERIPKEPRRGEFSTFEQPVFNVSLSLIDLKAAQ